MHSYLKKSLVLVTLAGTIITADNSRLDPSGKGEYLNMAFSQVSSQAIDTVIETREETTDRMEAEKRQEVVDFACEFIGNPYVWGGTSLTNGADCSGFVQSVYAHFGITLPRTSSSQRSAGEGVSYEDVLPGDIICYEGHVGIYIGNGEIVNARNPEKGIGITPATYKNILAVRRVL